MRGRHTLQCPRFFPYSSLKVVFGFSCYARNTGEKGVARKPYFHTSERASLLGGHSRDLSEHPRSGNVNLKISSQNRLIFALFSWTRYERRGITYRLGLNSQRLVRAQTAHNLHGYGAVERMILRIGLKDL